MNIRCLLAAWVMITAGCQNYVESTPREYFEGDDRENYRRIFGANVPEDVIVVNSVVVGYQTRLGVVTTDDFELELIASEEWIDNAISNGNLITGNPYEVEYRKKNSIRDWYAPKSVDQYEIYRDRTSVGYIHLLIDRHSGDDEHFRVFYSKH